MADRSESNMKKGAKKIRNDEKSSSAGRRRASTYEKIHKSSAQSEKTQCEILKSKPETQDVYENQLSRGHQGIMFLNEDKPSSSLESQSTAVIEESEIEEKRGGERRSLPTYRSLQNDALPRRHDRSQSKTTTSVQVNKVSQSQERFAYTSDDSSGETTQKTEKKTPRVQLDQMSQTSDIERKTLSTIQSAGSSITHSHKQSETVAEFLRGHTKDSSSSYCSHERSKPATVSKNKSLSSVYDYRQPNKSSRTSRRDYPRKQSRERFRLRRHAKIEDHAKMAEKAQADSTTSEEPEEYSTYKEMYKDNQQRNACITDSEMTIRRLSRRRERSERRGKDKTSLEKSPHRNKRCRGSPGHHHNSTDAYRGTPPTTNRGGLVYTNAQNPYAYCYPEDKQEFCRCMEDRHRYCERRNTECHFCRERDHHNRCYHQESPQFEQRRQPYFDDDGFQEGNRCQQSNQCIYCGYRQEAPLRRCTRFDQPDQVPKAARNDPQGGNQQDDVFNDRYHPQNVWSLQDDIRFDVHPRPQEASSPRLPPDNSNQQSYRRNPYQPVTELEEHYADGTHRRPNDAPAAYEPRLSTPERIFRRYQELQELHMKRYEEELVRTMAAAETPVDGMVRMHKQRLLDNQRIHPSGIIEDVVPQRMSAYNYMDKMSIQPGLDHGQYKHVDVDTRPGVQNLRRCYEDEGPEPSAGIYYYNRDQDDFMVREVVGPEVTGRPEEPHQDVSRGYRFPDESYPHPSEAKIPPFPKNDDPHQEAHPQKDEQFNEALFHGNEQNPKEQPVCFVATDRNAPNVSTDTTIPYTVTLRMNCSQNECLQNNEVAPLGGTAYYDGYDPNNQQWHPNGESCAGDWAIGQKLHAPCVLQKEEGVQTSGNSDANLEKSCQINPNDLIPETPKNDRPKRDNKEFLGGLPKDFFAYLERTHGVTIQVTKNIAKPHAEDGEQSDCWSTIDPDLVRASRTLLRQNPELKKDDVYAVAAAQRFKTGDQLEEYFKTYYPAHQMEEKILKAGKATQLELEELKKQKEHEELQKRRWLTEAKLHEMDEQTSREHQIKTYKERMMLTKKRVQEQEQEKELRERQRQYIERMKPPIKIDPLPMRPRFNQDAVVDEVSPDSLKPRMSRQIPRDVLTTLEVYQEIDGSPKMISHPRLPMTSGHRREVVVADGPMEPLGRAAKKRMVKKRIKRSVE